MAISLSQIEFLLSGGNNNNSPSKSLGGGISSFPIIGSLNNLFADVTSEEAEVGKTDFRCFYINNLSTIDSLFNSKIFIYSQKVLGSTVQLGIPKDTDVQELKIVGSVVSGSVVLKYNQQEISVPWGGSSSNFSSNIISSFESAGIPGVEVTFSGSSTITFNISFKGLSNYRNHPTLELFVNDLSGITKPIVTIKKIKEGKPINSIAPSLAVETVIPSGVDFYNTNSEEKVDLGTLRPSDFVPVWVKRTTNPNTDFEEKDYFIFKIQGDPFI